MTEATRRITAIANGQLGVVSRRQAAQAGVTTTQLRSRVSSGTLLKVGRNGYALPGRPTEPLWALRGLVADIGGHVWVSGCTAAALHGFDGYRLTVPFHVTVLRDRNVTRAGHVVHSTTRLDVIDRCVVDGIPSLSAARTLIDLARTERTDRLTAALDSGLRDLRFTEDHLHRRITALRERGRGGVPKLLQVIDGSKITRGAHSWLERRFLEVVQRAGLPRPQAQKVLSRRGDRTIRVDFLFARSDLVVEVLGYRFHRNKEQMNNDADRMNQLISGGFRVLQFTYDAIVERPSLVVTQLRSALN